MLRTDVEDRPDDQTQPRDTGSYSGERSGSADAAERGRDRGPATLEGPTPVERLVRYAVANNPKIAAAQFRAQALEERVPQAEALPDPTLMTTAFLEEIQTAAGPQEAALSLSQKFPWFGKRALRGQVAYYDALAAWSRVASAELEVVEAVKRAYFDLYFVQQATRETRRLEGPLEDVIAVAKARYETAEGRAGLEDLFQAQVELSKLKTDLIRLEEAQHKAQARLAAVLHLPPTTRIEALPTLDRRSLETTAENLVGLAASCQPEFEAYRRETARDQTAVDLACRDYWPDVTVSLNWFEMGDRGISPVANGRDAYSIGVGVNLPLNRRRYDAALREAENRASATERRYAAVKDEFQAEIGTLHAQFREHHRTYAILEQEIVPRSEETLEVTMEAYRAGRADFEQLMDVYRALLRFRIDVHRRLAQSEQALASLERAVGCEVTSASGADGDEPAEPLPPPLPPR